MICIAIGSLPPGSTSVFGRDMNESCTIDSRYGKSMPLGVGEAHDQEADTFRPVRSRPNLRLHPHRLTVRRGKHTHQAQQHGRLRPQFVHLRGAARILHTGHRRSRSAEWCTSREPWSGWTRAQLNTADSRAG